MNGVAQSYFLWDGGNLLAELNGVGTAAVAEYSYFPGADNPHAIVVGGQEYHPQVDGLGNVIAFTDNAQTVQRTYSYDAWGTLTGGTDTKPFANADRVRFKGAVWLGPEVDLYYMRSRWYEPKSGRFLTEDPTDIAGGLNLYAYAANDPVNARDPSGLELTMDGGGDGPGPSEFRAPDVCVTTMLPGYEIYAGGQLAGSGPPRAIVICGGPGGEASGHAAFGGGRWGRGGTGGVTGGRGGGTILLREPRYLQPELRRRGQPPEDPLHARLCAAAAFTVKQGGDRAKFGLPLLFFDMLFGGRLPDVNGVPVPDPRDVKPSETFDWLEAGAREAIPAFNLYRELGCGRFGQ